MDLPADLRPIPTQPWAERPTDMPLVLEECRTALWLNKGNVTLAAEHLKVTSARLRGLIRTSPRLQREIEEARERIVDRAEEVARDALEDPDRADAMARFVLGTQGRGRGWGTGNNVSVTLDQRTANTVIQWSDGTTIATPLPGKVIEGEFAEVETENE